MMLPELTFRALEKEARKQNMTVAQLIGIALHEYLVAHREE